MRVARCDRLHAEALGKLAQQRVPPPVAALVGTLELDEEPVAAERADKARRRVWIADRDALTRAAREADQAVVQLLQQRLVERGLAGGL